MLKGIDNRETKAAKDRNRTHLIIYMEPIIRGLVQAPTLFLTDHSNSLVLSDLGQVPNAYPLGSFKPHATQPR
jgi:hypothetical protein